MKTYFVSIIRKNKIPIRYAFEKWIDCIKFVQKIYNIIENKNQEIEIKELSEKIENNPKNEIRKYISRTSTIKMKINKIQEINKLPF